MLFVKAASMSRLPVEESKETSSPQWNPPRSKGRGKGAWIVRTVVSGRCRARPKGVKPVAESPRPWRRRRMFGEGPDVGVGGRVIVIGRFGGKSAWEGVFVGIVDGLLVF